MSIASPTGTPNFFAQHLGVRALPGQPPGTVRCVVVVRDEFLNPNRVLHGGVLFTMADSSMGEAIYTLLEPGRACTTIDIRIAYFRPVTEGEITCTSRVTHLGRTIAHVESEMFAGERRIAAATGTFAVLDAWRG